MTTTESMSYDVLVVGAGPGGLATAVSAARHGARVLVVERHTGTSPIPRATGVSTRTMEIFRTWGIAKAVRAGSVDVGFKAAAGPTLTDPALAPLPTAFPSPRQALAYSPALPACCPQDHIEPLLVEQVRRYGGAVRFGTELTGLHTDSHGVRAALTDRATGAVRAVRAEYVVGADGPRSTVRDALAIGLEHLGTLGEFIQVLFRADLHQVLGVPLHPIYFLSHPDAEGVFLPVGRDRWGYAVQWHAERGQSPADFTGARWTELLRIATGIGDLRPDIIGWLPFTMAAAVATAYRAGRGFLVGDAAHRMTPAGGVGMNTAIHDGHNLGWKLAWVVRGLADGGLLDSYEEERQPVGLRNALRSLNLGGIDPADGLPGDLGTLYRSAVIAGDDMRRPGYEDPSSATAAAGERAPHLWISCHGRHRSTVDLFDGRLTLIVGSSGDGWRSAAVDTTDTGLPMVALTAGREIADPRGRVAATYRLGESRPDGALRLRHLAGRAHPGRGL